MAEYLQTTKHRPQFPIKPRHHDLGRRIGVTTELDNRTSNGDSLMDKIAKISFMASAALFLRNSRSSQSLIVFIASTLRFRPCRIRKFERRWLFTSSSNESTAASNPTLVRLDG